MEAVRDAEVDQSRGCGHDDVARLDVEVDDPLRGQVMQGRADVQRQGQQLLEAQSVAADQGGEPRPVDELEHQMRALAVQLRAERAHEHRVREGSQEARLGRQRAQRNRVGDLVGPHDLGDDQGAQVVVPREVGLVAPAATEQPDGPAAGDDLVVLAEIPGVHRGH